MKLLQQHMEISKYTNLLEIVNKVSFVKTSEILYKTVINKSKWIFSYDYACVVNIEEGNNFTCDNLFGFKEKEIRSKTSESAYIFTLAKNQNYSLMVEENPDIFSDNVFDQQWLNKDITEIYSCSFIEKNKVKNIILFGTEHNDGFTKNERLQLSTMGNIISGNLTRINNYDATQKLQRELLESNHSLNELNDNLEIKNNKLQSVIEETKRLQKKIVAQEKLASLGNMSAGIAHELKNPLNIILNGSEIIYNSIAEFTGFIEKDLNLEELVSSAKQEFELLNHTTSLIRNHSLRAVDIINSMVGYSRNYQQEIELVKSNEVVETAYRDFLTSISNKDDPHILIKKDLQDIGIIPMYKVDISMAIINLLDNAYYALQQRVKKDPDKNYHPTLEIYLKSENKNAVIIIRDNGIGMSQETISKIFNPFYTLKPPGKGTGLGLSITHDIITKHDGEIVITSELNNFTEFVITLPLK